MSERPEGTPEAVPTEPGAAPERATEPEAAPETAAPEAAAPEAAAPEPETVTATPEAAAPEDLQAEARAIEAETDDAEVDEVEVELEAEQAAPEELGEDELEDETVVPLGVEPAVPLVAATGAAVPRRRGAPAPVAHRAPTQSELAVRVTDNVSRFFVIGTVVVFVAILAIGMLAGNGGLLTTTPAPTVASSVSAEPSASASAGASASAPPSESAAPSESTVASASPS